MCPNDGSTPFEVACVHFDHREEPHRFSQWRALRTALGALPPTPRLLMGDMNALTRTDYTTAEWGYIAKVRERGNWEQPTSELTDALRTDGWADLWQAAGHNGGASIQGARSTCRYDTRIDYIFADHHFREAWALQSVEHHATEATDHALVLAELTPVAAHGGQRVGHEAEDGQVGAANEAHNEARVQKRTLIPEATSVQTAGRDPQATTQETGSVGASTGLASADESCPGPISAVTLAAASGRLHHVTGDATLANYGKGRKLIAHVCNDKGLWGKGFVMAVSARWPHVAREYRDWHRAGAGVGFHLGAVQFCSTNNTLLTVANMVGEQGVKTGSKGPPVRYAAIEQALMKVGDRAASDGASVHMPRIATGLAGGERSQVEPMLVAMLAAHPTVECYVYDF